MKPQWNKSFGIQKSTLKHFHTMQTKIILLGLLAVIMSSCVYPRYLPSSDKIDINPNGSYIKIFRRTSTNITGEFIAIDSTKLVVLSELEHKCLTIPIAEIKRFKLRYAKPKNYGWTIPGYTFATICHGFLLVITAPLNLIVTVSVTSSGERAFKYSNKNISYDKLKMFARFPQGIPSDIDTASIKYIVPQNDKTSKLGN